MIVDTRILSGNKFITLERISEGGVVGHLLRLDPVPGPPDGPMEASGTYRQYSTPVCRNLGEAELQLHEILKRLREENPDF